MSFVLHFVGKQSMMTTGPPWLALSSLDILCYEFQNSIVCFTSSCLYREKDKLKTTHNRLVSASSDCTEFKITQGFMSIPPRQPCSVWTVSL